MSDQRHKSKADPVTLNPGIKTVLCKSITEIPFNFMMKIKPGDRNERMKDT